MALVYRNGRIYSYKSVRRNGRVTSEYRGSGELAVLIGALDAEEERDREAKREELRSERVALESAERSLTEYFERVEDLTRAALHASGLHQHKRQWRRRRVRRHEC
jgi:hypothetical protein